MALSQKNVVFISNKTLRNKLWILTQLRFGGGALSRLFLIKQMPKTGHTFPWSGCGLYKREEANEIMPYSMLNHERKFLLNKA